MANFNQTNLIGRLTRDPEVKYVGQLAICEISLAFNTGSKDKQKSNFIEVTFFDKTAENAGEYLSKGKEVLVTGELSQDSWEDKTTGQKRSKHVLKAFSFQMLGSPTPKKSEASGQESSENSENSENDESVPF